MKSPGAGSVLPLPAVSRDVSLSPFLSFLRFYKLHERKCEPIVMTVPRKVRFTQTFFSDTRRLQLTLSRPVRAVGPVPGGPVPRHHRARALGGGGRVVRREGSSAHPNFSKGWLHSPHQGQGVQSSQESPEDHDSRCRGSNGRQRGETVQPPLLPSGQIPLIYNKNYTS